MNVGRLHNRIIEIAGNVIHGVDSNRRIHFRDGTSVEGQALAQSIADAYETYAIETNKTAIETNGIDTAVITLNLDETVDYVVTRNNALYASGQAEPEGGVITLNLATILEGVYVVELISTTDYKTGSVTIYASSN